MDRDKLIEIILLLLRHQKGIVSTLEKLLHALKEESDAKT